MGKAIPAALAAFGLVAATPSQAAYVVNIEEVGNSVIATGSGSIDLTGLTLLGTGESNPSIDPVDTGLFLGTLPSGIVDVYGSGTEPPSWGTGGSTLADAGSGNHVAAARGVFGVATGYVSGTDLGTSTATWIGASFASLGLTPGSYTSTWSADSFTVNVGRAIDPIPEPGAWAMMLLGLCAIGRAVRGRRRWLREAHSPA
jgi:hypothetical protein